MNRNRSEFDWDKFLRVLALGTAIFFWGLSVYFSSDGFTRLGANVGEEKKWLGVCLAIAFTVTQLVWNRMRGNASNLTIWVVGICIYAYSLVTDFFGIRDWFGFEKEVNFQSIFTVFISLVVEILPEPLALWAITGSFSGGDFLSNMFGKNNSDNSVSPSPLFGKNNPVSKQSTHTNFRSESRPSHIPQQRSSYTQNSAQNMQKSQRRDSYSQKGNSYLPPTEDFSEQGEREKAFNDFLRRGK